jgi:hypothetical protein
MNHFRIPYIFPFKMVPSTATPGIHFDQAWSREQIKSFEARAYYRQKWEKADTTLLQIESSIVPDNLKIYNSLGAVAKSIPWTAVYSATSYSIYQLTFDISDLAEGVYYLYQRVTQGPIEWKALSEPVHMKTSWPGTLLFTFKNSYNDQDVSWTTGIEMKFRCEAGIMDFQPERDRTAYINEIHDVASLNGVPYRSFKLYIGDARGVAPYVLDILNRIFCCDSIDIQGLKYQSADSSKFEVTRFKGYPLYGGSIEITEALNRQSLEFADTTPLAPGILVAYNIENAFFSPGSLVPVQEVENT